MADPIKEPKCRNCWDKGFATELTGGTFSRGDFIGDRNYRTPGKIEIRYCKCAKGRRMSIRRRPPRPKQ